MCQYITVTLPENTNPGAVKPVFDKYELAQRIIHNPYIKSQIRKGDQCLNTTLYMCDCGSVIASNRKEMLPDEKHVGDMQRMKKKGWSDTKIKRWLEDKKKGSVNKKLQEDNIRWMNFIQEITNVTQVGRLGLFIHTYSQSLEEEEVKFEGIHNIPIETFTENTLESLDYNNFYYFTK